MKKALALMVSFMLFFSWMTAGAGFAENRPVQVVVTIFPIYDWVREVAGDYADLTLLLDSGVDLHSFQPTVQDIVNIQGSDLFIYVGGESDEWVDDVIGDTPGLNLLEALGEDVRMEETIEGMEAEEEEEEGEEADEHVWLSLRNAQKLTRAIAEALAAADPEHAGEYRANAEAYCEKLKALDQQYEEAVQAAAFRTILFGDRFPFRYLAEDYGLDYFAAFSGCSAETEASFATILFLAKKVDELGLPAVLKVESTDGRIAETIVSSTEKKDQKIVALHSMQSVTAEDVKNGASYLDIMTDNLAALKEALN